MKLFVLLALVSSTAFAETICGDDSRTPSKDQRIGRLTYNGKVACTVTMIGKSCAISAGHCEPFLKNSVVEFNLPADAKSTYKVAPASIAFENNGEGRDWAVFKIEANAVTKSLPGDVYGVYKVSSAAPKIGSNLQIAGYGIVQGDFMGLSGTQQIAYGKITDISEQTSGDGVISMVLEHDVDTEEGGSGSAIVLSKEKVIVGVHTHGSLQCSVDSNKGTLISESKKLQKAIQDCLK